LCKREYASDDRDEVDDDRVRRERGLFGDLLHCYVQYTDTDQEKHKHPNNGVGNNLLDGVLIGADITDLPKQCDHVLQTALPQTADAN
jgi:hypothetical protein